MPAQQNLHRVTSRAGLTIGQMPGASRLDIKTLLYCFFHIFRLFTTRQKCRAFWLLGLAYRSGKLITVAFIVFE